MLAINLYYLYLRGMLIVRPRELTLGGAAGAASGDTLTAAAPPARLLGLGFAEGALEALRLPAWAVLDALLVFWASILAARVAACSAFISSRTTLALSLATRLSSASCSRRSLAAAQSSFLSAFASCSSCS